MIGRIGKAWNTLWGREAVPARAEWKSWNAQRAMGLNQQLAAYEAAIRRPDLWTLADFRDADASLLPDKRRIIRSHARYELMNNPVVARIMNVWVADVVGEFGPIKQHRTGFGELDRFLDRLWARWWEHARQASKMRTAVRSEGADGEAGAVIISNPYVARRQPLHLDTRLFECDRLASPDWDNANRSDYVDGVHVDPATQEPVAYDILRAHPGTENLDQIGDMFVADTIDREHVLHAFRQYRPEQHRGVCRFAPVLGFAGNLRKFMDSDVSREALRAAFVAVLKSMAGGEEDEGSTETESTEDAGWWQKIDLPNRSGAMMMLPEGYDMSQFSTDSGGSSLDIYHRIVGCLIAGCFVMPAGRALGKQDGASYPGVRSDMEPYHKTIASDRSEIWEPFWLLPLHDEFLVEASLLSEFRDIMERVPEGTRLDLNNIEWTWPNKELVVDPSREETARKSRFAMGITDRERESPYTDLEAADTRNAKMWGFGEDVDGYRRGLFHATVGIPVAATATQPGETASEFGGLGRRQFTNNRKAIRDILQDFIDGTATVGATQQMLQSLGLPTERAQALIEDARDKSIDDPELTDAADAGAQPPD